MAEDKSPNVRWHAGSVSREQRAEALGQRGVILWFTGLSGSGKSTVAHAVEKALIDARRVVYVLDGDNVRHGLNGDLGFSPEDRSENIRRIGEVSKLFADAGVVTLCAFVSPYRADRDRIRSMVPEGGFVEIHVATSLEECERRDTKGLYKKARAGEITNLTGLGAPYEPPLSPELVVDTGALSLEQSLTKVVGYLESHGYLAGAPLTASER